MGVSGVFLRGFETTSKIISKQFLGSFRMVLINFQGYLRYFQECFKEASRKCYENLKGVSKGGFQEGFKDVTRTFHITLKCLSKVFHGSSKTNFQVFQRCFKHY